MKLYSKPGPPCLVIASYTERDALAKPLATLRLLISTRSSSSSSWARRSCPAWKAIIIYYAPPYAEPCFADSPSVVPTSPDPRGRRF